VGRDEMTNLRGLHTNPNQYLTPNGAARVAKNVWFTRPGIASKRRGFSRWSQTLTYAVRKLMAYRGMLIAHTENDRLNRIDSTSGVVSFISGSVAPPSSSYGNRVRGCTSGNNFYLATSDAPKRLSNTSEFMTAGGLVAPGFDNMGIATPLTTAGGFLSDGNSCAYRYELVHYDAFGREIVGPVSGRLIASNVNGVAGWVTTEAKNYTVRARLPPEATQHDVIRFYRSGQKTAGQALDDDLKMVFEVQLKQNDITNGYYDLVDVVPDALRGAFIYTSPNAAEGLGQNNELPPACIDIAHHRGRVWYAGTTQRSMYELQILAVGGTSGIQNNDVLRINGTSIVLTAKTAAPGTNEYLIVTSGTASYNIEQTALNLVSAINKSASNTIVWARYMSGPDDVPGKILLISRTTTGVLYSVSVGAGSKRDCWNPSMLPYEHIVNLTRTAGTVRASVTSGTQSFKVGEQVSIGPGGAGSGGSTFGIGPFTVTAIDGAGAWFEYAEAGLNGTLNGQSATIFADDISGFTQEVKLNRIYYSKFLEPDAVPWENWIDVGAEDKEIVAIVAQGETLQVWKEDGIYRIVGSDELSFEPLEVDVNVKALCREMVVAFQGRVAGLTDKGILLVSETGQIDDLDFPIRADVLQQITSQGADLVNLCFMVAYEAEDMLFVFWSGNKDLASGSNSSCNLGYVFSGQAGEWSHWWFDINDAQGNGKTCGIMNPFDRTLYFGDRYQTTFSQTYVYKERKSRSSADYRDSRGDNSSASITWQYSPVIQTGHAAGLDKQFNECGLLFNGTQPVSLTVADENEFGNGQTHTVTRNSAQYGNRIWPAASNGRWLGLTITHDTIDEGVDLAGVNVEYEVLNLAVQK
jgi:hypothetical protein